MSNPRQQETPKPDRPLEPLREGEFARTLNRTAEVATPATSPEKERNKSRAQIELSMISELSSSSAFTWFMENCLVKHFEKWRDLLHAPDTATRRALAGFMSAKENVRWLTEREFEHRRLLDPNDPVLTQLREKLKVWQ